MISRPHPIRRALAVAAVLAALGAAGVLAQTTYKPPPCPFRGSPSYPGLPGVCHPYPQPRPPISRQSHFCISDLAELEVPSCVECPDACITRVDTGEGVLPAEMALPPGMSQIYSANVPPPLGLPPDFKVGPGGQVPANPWNYLTFPGTNLLPNVYTNMYDGGGVEMANTLPSTPDVPYNLHPDPVVSEINPISPEDDLFDLFHSIRKGIFEIVRLRHEPARTAASAAGEIDFHLSDIAELIGLGIDIIEGNSLADSRLATRAYDGFPLLHYKGPEKVGKVEPIFDAAGNKVGGNVTVHQIWFGQRIEADTAFLDPSEVLDVPWTVTYIVDTLNRGHDDFSPFANFLDSPWFHPEAGREGELTWNAGDYCTVGGTADERRAAGCERLPWHFVKGTKSQHGFGTPCVAPTEHGGPWTPPADASGTCAPGSPPAHIGMDQTFFNMEEGTRTVFRLGMPPGDYLNLIYTWGWRMHPPRIQVMENVFKKVPKGAIVPAADSGGGGPQPDGICPASYAGCRLPQFEQAVFCNPATSPTCATKPEMPECATNTCGIPDLPMCTSVTDSEEDKLYAIGRIGDLAPAKRMWRVLGTAAAASDELAPAWEAGLGAWRACSESEGGDCQAILEELLAEGPLWDLLGEIDSLIASQALPAFDAWKDRTQLPCYERDPNAEHNVSCLDGLNPDPGSDITVLYVNNTTYGQLTAGGWVRWPDWETRFASWKSGYGAPGEEPVLHVTLHNGDHFPHAYNIADFGGNRGWENAFKSSVKVAGSGCWFTFGRAHFWINTGKQNGFLCAPPGLPGDEQYPHGVPSTRRFEVKFNFEPSRRLRFYQFDPFHHDVAIYSVH